MSAVPRRGTPDLVGVELPETKDMPKRVRNGILFQDLKKEKKKILPLVPRAGPSKPTTQLTRGHFHSRSWCLRGTLTQTGRRLIPQRRPRFSDSFPSAHDRESLRTAAWRGGSGSFRFVFSLPAAFGPRLGELWRRLRERLYKGPPGLSCSAAVPEGGVSRY